MLASRKFAGLAVAALACCGLGACNLLTGIDDLGTSGAGGAEAPLVSGLTISRIAINQAVAIDLMTGGMPAAAARAPVVEGRPALLRVFVTPGPAWKARKVVAVLDAKAGTKALPAQTVALSIASASDEATLTSTFNFKIPAEQMTGDLEYSVTLREAALGDPRGPTDGARWPVKDTSPVGAQSSKGGFKMVLVPLQYKADGTGRLPDTGAHQLAAYHDRFFSTYPTPNLEVSVHAPVAWSQTIDPAGTGWAEVLDFTCKLRVTDKVAPNVWYYGIFSPAPSFGQFCSAGCIAGLATLADVPSDDTARCAVGLGFTGPDQVDTALQEVAHAFGRNHAPCGQPDAPDPAYPYPGASIGGWGYDLTFDALQSPTQKKDFMSYCTPVWISDYTYDALFKRLLFINAHVMKLIAPEERPRLRSVLLQPDGSLTWGLRIQPRTPPQGAPVTVTLLGEGGAAVGAETAHFYAYSSLPGGRWLLPEPGRDVRAISVPGYGTLAVTP